MQVENNYSHWNNQKLDDFILTWCPNVDLPRKRGGKIAIVRDIKMYKKKFPMLIPHPEEEGKELIISLDTFMQGEKL